ncbi:MAG: 30S ribosome-binding factor RbfA [Anaerolineales bacterium]|nr:30S ribosome-binding factor RbfA [Anaerolineae bacterium]PWB50975.1 MAG: 30S ribosome-binding factor RbfA [Anaerolineales bacterium]
MVSKTRLTRISDRIREELSEIVLMESNDPRLKGVTITDVEVDKELAYAEVYVSAIEGVERSQEVLAGFEHAQGYLRSELAHRLDLRVFPRLRFHWDSTFEKADHIERLLISLHQTDSQEKVKSKRKRVGKNEGL